MRPGELIGLNGVELWANTTPLVGGLRLRLSVDDWERLGLFRGQMVRVRTQKGEEVLHLAEATEVPPFVWAVLVERVRAAG